MKLNSKTIFASIFLALFITASIAQSSKLSTAVYDESNEIAHKYVKFTKAGRCPNNIPSGYNIAGTVQNTGTSGVEFKLTTLVSTDNTDLVFIFTGYNSENIKQIQGLYKDGKIESSNGEGYNNENVEPKFAHLYNKYFRNGLLNAISQYGSGVNQYTFVGHSFGGSMAVIAADDAISSGKIQNCETKRCVRLVTYGALSVGNEAFVNKMKSVVNWVRVSAKEDYFTQLPRCVYTHRLVGGAPRYFFNCFRDSQVLLSRYAYFGNYFNFWRPVGSYVHHVGPVYNAHNFGSYVSPQVHSHNEHSHSEHTHSNTHNEQNDHSHSNNHSHNNHHSNTTHSDQSSQTEHRDHSHSNQNHVNTHHQNSLGVASRYIDHSPLKRQSKQHQSFLEKRKQIIYRSTPRLSVPRLVAPIVGRRLFAKRFVFPTCTRFDGFYECPVNVEPHRVFFGTNLEVC